VSGIAFEFTAPSRGVVSALPLVLGVLIEKRWDHEAPTRGSISASETGQPSRKESNGRGYFAKLTGVWGNSRGLAD